MNTVLAPLVKHQKFHIPFPLLMMMGNGSPYEKIYDHTKWQAVGLSCPLPLTTPPQIPGGP